MTVFHPILSMITGSVRQRVDTKIVVASCTCFGFGYKLGRIRNNLQSEQNLYHNQNDKLLKENEALKQDLDVCRHQQNELADEIEILKKDLQLLGESKNLLDVKVEKIQLQLSRELEGSGSYVDGQATPFLLDRTVKTLHTRVSSLANGLIHEKGPFLEHLKRFNTDPVHELTIHFSGAFLSRSAHVKYMLKAWLYEIFFRDFENESFYSGGFTLFFDGDKRRTNSFDYFQRLTDSDSECGVLCTDSIFDTFCIKKLHDFLSLWPENHSSVTASPLLDVYMTGKSTWTNLETSDLEIDPAKLLIRSFVAVAKHVWALHKLCLSFEQRGQIFRVGSGTDYLEDYMESVVSKEDDENFIPKVGFMICPGFILRRSIVKCQIYLAGSLGEQF